MKKTEEAISKYKRVVSTTCDICGKDTVGDNWGRGFEEKSVIIEYREGTEYPEGRWGTIYSVDVCPGCFMSKIVPFLRDMGVKLEAKEWEG